MCLKITFFHRALFYMGMWCFTCMWFTLFKHLYIFTFSAAFQKWSWGRRTVTQAHMQIKAINSLWWSEMSWHKQSVPLPWKPLSPHRPREREKHKEPTRWGGSDRKTVKADIKEHFSTLVFLRRTRTLCLKLVGHLKDSCAWQDIQWLVVVFSDFLVQVIASNPSDFRCFLRRDLLTMASCVHWGCLAPTGYKKYYKWNGKAGHNNDILSFIVMWWYMTQGFQYR